MSNIAEQLLSMKEQIKRIELKKAECEGRKSQLIKELERMGYENIEQAEEKIREIKIEIQELENQLEQGLQELREKYEW